MSEIRPPVSYLQPCPWHGNAFAALQARAGSGMPHAVLLAGEAGIGKRAFAEAFATWRLCESPVGGHACGECRACRFCQGGTHPDLYVLVPEAQRPKPEKGEGDEGEGGGSGSRKKKPSREIRVDDIRDLIGFAARTAQRGDHRFAIIDPAHAMNVNAANALLKTLEEPGSGLVLFLVTEAPAMLPATVRSRCQQLRLSSPSYTESLAWLRPRIGSPERAEALLAAAGSPLRALALEGTRWPELRRSLARSLVDVLGGRESAVRFAALAADLTQIPDEDGPATEPLLLDWLPTLVSDAVRLGSGIPESELRNADLAADLRRLVEARSTQPLFLLGDDIALLRRQLQAGAGLNRQLLWEEVLLRWSPRPGAARPKR